jgi:hypothetical protein
MLTLFVFCGNTQKTLLHIQRGLHLSRSTPYQSYGIRTMDFVKLGLRATNYIVENHFDKIPDEHFGKIPDGVFSPREALRKIRHRRQKSSSSSPSQDEQSPTSAKSPDKQRKSSKQDSKDTNSEEGYEADEEKAKENIGGERRRSRRRSIREDPYYLEAERRTQNPRDYDPQCFAWDPSSLNNPYWAAKQQSSHPLTTAPRGPSSSSLYVSHPADPSFRTQQRPPTSPTTGPLNTTSLYNTEHTPRRRSLYTSPPAPAPGYNDTYYSGQQRFPPPNATVPGGSPAPARYDPKYPDSAPNIDPHYPAQYHWSSPKPPLPPSTTYAAATYVPYPYPAAAAVTAAFGPEKPYEYEYEPSSPPPTERRSRSTHSSRSRHRSSRRHRKNRPGVARRASSTGDTPDLDRSRSMQRSSRQKDRPGVRRRASSTGDVDNSLNHSQGRKRDFGLPSKLSSSDRAIAASSLGAVTGGLVAQEVASHLRKPGGKSGNNPTVLTLLGAVVGGLGANLIAGKEERKQQAGERGSMRGWMDDIRGERREALKGWKGVKGHKKDKDEDSEGSW